MAKTDNTDHEKGFVYQSLVALQKYHDYSKKFKGDSEFDEYKIGYEVDGDVTIWKGDEPLAYYEVKHHINSGNLTLSSNDFWKTIYNMYQHYASTNTKNFKEYILLTTEKDKIAFNEMSLNDKLKYVTEERNTDGKCYFSEKFKTGDCYNKDLLEELLGKVKVMADQPTIIEYKNQLKVYFSSVNADNYDEFISKISSLFSDGTILSDDEERKVSFSDIKNNIDRGIQEYSGGSKMLQDPTSDFASNIRDDKYIQELARININENNSKHTISNARKCYIFSVFNKKEICNKPYYLDDIVKYEQKMLSEIVQHKEASQICNKDEVENFFNTDERVTSLDYTNIPFKDTMDYKRGTMHMLVQNGYFKWRYDEEE